MPPQIKKRKKDRACDACRRRKTKCDGPWMANNLCTNCIQTRKPCTYVESSKPRGPPKAYVTGLEDRLEALEALLQQIRPDGNFSEELGPPVLRNSWRNQEGFSTASSSNSATRKSSFTLTANALPLLSTPFPTQPATLNLTVSPLSTHLKFHSRRRDKRPRKIPDTNLSSYRDGYTDSDKDSSSDGSSSSANTEEIVITSLVGRTKFTLHAAENDDSAEDYNIRFHGRSSTAGLVEATRQFKYMHMKETMGPVQQGDSESPNAPDNNVVAQTRRPRFWTTPDWELNSEGTRVDDPEILQVFIAQFPPPDLSETLIELYFRHSNSIFPLLHRPTFNQQWQEQLHHRNIWFVCVCVSIFAVASRWCQDERVLPANSAQEDRSVDWSAAGRHYFEMASEIHRVRRSLFHPASLFEIQSFSLNAMYLGGTTAYPASWLIISAGIRKAQDVGAHRKKVYRGEPNIDDELWKRAFWHLVVFDRVAGAILGRSCALAEEDFDLNLPLEVDDDYWEAKQDGRGPFKQPRGVPSTVTAFKEFIKLTQIMAFALRTLYAVGKSKIYRSLIPMERESLVKQLSLAMEEWKKGIPEHLQWQDKMDISLFSDQSAILFTMYHLTRILVHRPLITASLPPPLFEANPANQYDFAPSIPAVADPAIAICTDAARSCALIIDLQLRQNINRFHVPIIIGVSYSCSAFLLLTTWKLKVEERDLRRRNIVDIKPPLAQRIEEKVADIKIFVRALETLRHRWDVVEPLLQEVNESLRGLESQTSDSDVPRPDGNAFKDIPYSKIIHHDPQLQMQANLVHPQHQIQREHFSAFSPPPRDYHHPRDTEPVVRVQRPQPHSGSIHQSDSKTRSHPTSEPLSGLPPVPFKRARAMSATTVNVHWKGRNERTLPFISSMRRTSYPNLSSQYSTQEGLQPRTTSEALAAGIQPAFGSHESGVRYEDVNMHLDNEMPLLNTRHLHHQQASSSKSAHGLSRGAHDKRSYGAEDWSHPLQRNTRVDRSTLADWIDSTAPTVASYRHSHHSLPSQDEYHGRVQDPYNPAYTL